MIFTQEKPNGEVTHNDPRGVNCRHDGAFGLPCGDEVPCPDCGELLDIRCDGDEGRCPVCGKPK